MYDHGVQMGHDEWRWCIRSRGVLSAVVRAPSAASPDMGAQALIDGVQAHTTFTRRVREGRAEGASSMHRSLFGSCVSVGPCLHKQLFLFIHFMLMVIYR